MPKPKSQPKNPIRDATAQWLASEHLANSPNNTDPARTADLLNSIPKRFIVYEPLVLLPTGSFTNLPWISLLEECSQDARDALWSLILKELSGNGKGELTHLAINEGIPLHKTGDGEENVLRSPSGLRMLYGNFGASNVDADCPSISDFEDAFWASTKQNGIYQTWAPRWTMFSRGNVKEKARLLSFGAPKPAAQDDCWAVDLYAGIGYFVFCYASLGMRVLCWEINPWSVEGLRRGAKANRWSVRIVQGAELERPMGELLAGGERIVVFLEDNQKALARVQTLWELNVAKDIRHINGGFLPTSQPVWEQAWEMTRHSSQACLHLHENVGVADIEARKKSIQELFDQWRSTEDTTRKPAAGHVELVKTFAPGVWHCVFDVDIVT
jgi:tRNA wybutosine-synthesizing protein 2